MPSGPFSKKLPTERRALTFAWAHHRTFIVFCDTTLRSTCSSTSNDMWIVMVRHIVSKPVITKLFTCYAGWYLLEPIVVFLLLRGSKTRLLKDTVMASILFNLRGPSYLGLTWSVSWPLMLWFLTSPGHQQSWYWLCRICRYWFYLRTDFRCLCHMNVE